MTFLRRHAMLLILTFIFTINAADRQAIVILLQDIKRDLQLSDTDLGLLTGFAFVVIYVVMGIPMAVIADRGNRSRLIAAALLVWGAATTACGFARTFAELAAARCGVGIGEAACAPASHSMIADLYPPARRATALSIYGAGFFVGAFLGLWLAGLVASIYGWRAAFFAVGIPPIILSVLVYFFMPEAPRVARQAKAAVSLGEAIRTIFGVSSVRWYVVGGAFGTFAAFGMLVWLPALMIRSYGMTQAEAGAAVGAINGVGGMVVTIAIGMAADAASRRDKQWNLWIPVILYAISVPATAAAFLSQSAFAILACYAIPASLLAACTAPIISYTQQIMPSSVHAMVTAIIFFVFNIFGFGGAPLAIGLMSDAFTPSLGDAALQHALLWLTLPLSLAALCVYMGIRRARGDERATAAAAEA